MKNSKLIILFTLIFCCFISCEDIQKIDDKTTYYQFNEIDYNSIINYNYTINQIIIYQNQFGEQIRFKVISNTIKKYNDTSDGTFSGGGGILESYYDSKIIKFEVLENQANFLREQASYIFSKSKNIFKNGIKLPMWNVEESTFFDEVDRPFNIYMVNYNTVVRSSITINNHLYENVVNVTSNSSTPLPSFFDALLPNNVNKIYYDYDFGIIQFNDLDGKEWKVIYPQ